MRSVPERYQSLEAELAPGERLHRFLMNPLWRAVAAHVIEDSPDPCATMTRIVARAMGQLANETDLDEPLLVLDAVEDALSDAVWPMPESPLFLAPTRLLILTDLARELRGSYRKGDCVAGLNKQDVVRLHLAADRLCHQAERQTELREKGLFKVRPDWLPLPDDENLPEAARSAPDVIRARLIKLRGRLYEHLLSGPTRFEERGWRLVKAFSCVCYVIGEAQRNLHVQTLSPSRVWYTTPEGWDVTRPLLKEHWVTHFLDTFPGIDHDPCHDTVDPDLRYWLVKLVAKEARESGLFEAYRDQIMSLLAVPPGLVELARCIRSNDAESQADSRWCARLWLDYGWWERLRQESPQLMRLAWVAVSARVFKPGQQLDVLKRHMLSLGCGQRGWAAMAREGRAYYALALTDSNNPGEELRWAACFARLLAPIEEDDLPPQELLCSLKSIGHLIGRDLNSFSLPAELLKLAATQLRDVGRQAEAESKSKVKGMRTLPERYLARTRFMHEDWLGVVVWMHSSRPVFRAQEWARGWPHVIKRARRWALRMRAQGESAEWTSPVQELAFGKFVARALCSRAALELEGVEMAHCVADYADDCLAGITRIFSITRIDDGRREATVCLNLVGDQWDVVETRGRLNRTPDYPVFKLVVRLRRACNDAEGRDQRDEPALDVDNILDDL